MDETLATAFMEVFPAGVGKAKSAVDGWEIARRLDRPPVLEVRATQRQLQVFLRSVFRWGGSRGPGVRWHMSVTPALERLEQEDPLEFEASQSSIMTLSQNLKATRPTTTKSIFNTFSL